eukprot:s2527_g3.t1
MDLLVKDIPPGRLFDIVAEVVDTNAGNTVCSGISPAQHFLVKDTILTKGKYTFYDLQRAGETDEELPTCCFDTTTEALPHPAKGPFSKVCIIDLCSGMGGFSIGSSLLGMTTTAFVEINPLACDALRANFMSPVLQKDISHPEVIREVHKLKEAHFLEITGGFPCQGYSCQGDQLGFLDPRSHTLYHIMRSAWLLQADATLLECVDNVRRFADTQELIDHFAQHADWHCLRMIFDLLSQWPVKRNRFWCLMLSKTIPELHIPVWPTTAEYQNLASIMPFNAVWPETDEHDLAWDADENCIYWDPAYGDDQRVLQPQGTAPTALHSWGHVTRPCSCGCRKALSKYRLLQGGARGFGLVSTCSGCCRHLHPAEAALLCTVPANYQFPMSCRAALCLLGQIAAPLQVFWIQSHLLSHLQWHFWGWTGIDPLAGVGVFQNMLATHAKRNWITTDMYQPRHIHVSVQDDTSILQISLTSPATVRTLAHAEKMLCGWGHYAIVKVNGHRMHPDALLHPDTLYTIEIRKCAQAAALPAIAPIHGGGPVSMASCLSDKTIWNFMRALNEYAIAQHPDLIPFMLYPFRATDLLTRAVPARVSADWQHRYQHSSGSIYVICETQQHWILLKGSPDPCRDGLSWVLYDGLRGTHALHQATLIATTLSAILGKGCCGLQLGLGLRQTQASTCGTLALVHLAAALDLTSIDADVHVGQIHQLLLHQQEHGTIYAGGSDELAQTLAELLSTKGVGRNDAPARAQQVITKLGNRVVQNIMAGRNPWAELKSAASKPGTMFRLITAEEQAAYIEMRAKTKHGAQVRNHKGKKSTKSAGSSGPVLLDPDQFELDSSHFQDTDEEPVAQIHFNAVEADQRGVALCTTAMAYRFLNNPEQISTDALALLLVDPPGQDIVDNLNLQKIVIPAKCTATKEHTLIFGHIMQLGELQVTRTFAGKGSNPEVIKTQVIKFQAFRDQLPVNWADFAAAPIRALVHHMDSLKLCRGESCGHTCKKFHPGIDEALDSVIFEVWARSFFDQQGHKIKPDEASLFTAFMRVPIEALQQILVTTPPGVYAEPRGQRPREHDDKFRVIWLPNATYQEALHQSKMFSSSICLMRMRNKYGIRVAKADEKLAWSKLRPGVDFIDMELQLIHELFPIPHGTQRHAVGKLLADWGWKARPLQPGKGNFQHMAWRVGSQEPPPHPVMKGFQMDIVISQVKEMKRPEVQPQLIASSKTQKHLRSAPAKASTSTPSADPWQEPAKDPWATFNPRAAAHPSGGNRQRFDAICTDLKSKLTQEMEHQAQATWQAMAASSAAGPQPHEDRIQALEVGLTELKHQNAQFGSWFQQAGDRMQATENAVQAVQHTLNTHQNEIHALGSTFQSTMKTIKQDLPFSPSRSSFGITRFLFWLLVLLAPVDALQQGHLFARRYIISSAAAADREIGSGGVPCSVPEQFDEPQSLSAPSTLVPYLCPPSEAVQRYGEARHPGPHLEDLLTVGVSNPGGLRRKEDILLGLGPGLWSMAETHLTQQTFKSCSGILRQGAQKMNRQVRFHGGAPAPLRQGSTWAGTWTGVGILSDYPTSKLDIPWPMEHWDSGRVLLTRHWVSNTPLTVGTFYGYAKGPTWPKARQLSDQLLENYTQELVLGMSGVRMIMGDFNQEPGSLLQHQLWLRHGWRNAQQLAADMFQHVPVATCKGATSPDQIWLSPEAIHLFRGLQVQDDFMDHSTVSIQLHIPAKPLYVYKWPRPAKIPWQNISLDGWHPSCPVDFQPGQDSTLFLQRWAQAYECSIFEQAQQVSDYAVPSHCRGRAQRLQPERQLQATPTCKSSREGEVKMMNAMAGTATRIWFRQLRRLQSLKHAVAAGNQSPEAILYRCDLWKAIKKAAGFVPNFEIWWSAQTHSVDGVPQCLPHQVPSESTVAIAIYESFHCHFRAFEAWHLNQRATSLKTKYVGNLEALFQDLRHDPKQPVETLWKDHHYTILAVDNDDHQLHLDAIVHPHADSVWMHHDHMTNITGSSADLCTVSGSADFSPGDELLQRCFVTDTNDVLHAFETHWRARWSALAEVPPEAWQRIQRFTAAYMPTHSFDWQPLEATLWLKATKKFKKRAARGPDGFDKLDLVNMPTSYVDSLLCMLTDIEVGTTQWPDQLRFGTVIGQAKTDQAHDASQYRPITLFSVVYRNWARIRTKQLLNQLSLMMPPEALGFLPHRETAEVWLPLQATIELMLQWDQPFSGMSTDLKRAFNNIGRCQVFHVAKHLGLPGPLLNAWSKFLDTFVRRFDVMGCLGTEMTSTSGFPEGCPLSIVSMLTVNWSYHVYMKAFCPSVWTYSFVDNLTLAAQLAGQVAQAFFALKTLCELFGLHTDDEKTYVWSLTKEGRDAMTQLGFPCFTDASELGGAMTYGRGRRTRVMRAKGDNLKPKWDKLRKSFAPQLQKYDVLPKVFWPAALHGSSNCLIADNYAMDLRRAAVKALGVSGAGSNPMLRLSLSDNMQNDPGYYQLFQCVVIFRRMLRKTPDLLPMWKVWMQGFRGKLLPGPFSRLLHCLHGIGWAVLEPPHVQDHDGRTWNLILIDNKTLRMVLQDAWLQFVASQVNHKTMRGLQGLEGSLTLLDVRKMLPLDRARYSALTSGAFVSTYEHAKYDHTKTPMCTLCAVEDDRFHWLQCPRFQHLRRSISGWLVDNVELPSCAIHHLLVPRLQSLRQWRDWLHALPQDRFQFCFSPPFTGFHHVFLDGSCSVETHKELQLASWAVVSATAGQPIAFGPLAGITQTIDRAELSALRVALLWADGTELDMCIWSDSQSTVSVAAFIMQYDTIPDEVANYDLWHDIHELLKQRASGRTHIRWIPAHLSPSQAEDPFEDWIIHWNDLADRLAVHANTMRTSAVLTRRDALRKQLDGWADRLRQLREFFFLVADSNQRDSSHGGEEIQVISSDEEDDVLALNLSEHLPVNWHARTEGYS